MNKIYITNEQKDMAVTQALRGLIRRAVNGALRYEGFEKDAEVSVTLTTAEGIRELNAEYRDKDAVTDVLSFPIFDDTEDEMAVLGDIVLCLSRADEQAKEFGHSFEREVAFLTVHSVLHLLGYDHETGEEDEREMFDRQRLIMEYLEIER
ncbi:MAG: rRNA maturation RNase YbeY [Clostridia bacterium]|nr:rRNA maturation RNase YbeY [Clostridia bacterium]